jgi:hypothetical protein
MTFPTEWKNKHVPNHQAVDDYGINVYTCLYYIYIHIYIYTCGIVWKAVWEWRWILDLKCASILK